MDKITFVTGNSNKLAEVQALLPHITLRSQSLDLPELQGTAESIATEKCKTAARLVRGAVITEDTSLEFRALGRLPGPYIKWFLESLELDGLNTLLAGFEDKRATALTIFAYAPGPDVEPILFEGRAEGKIVPARGSTQFGWDAIFESNDLGQTFGEATREAKGKTSHRGRAMQVMRQHLESL
ncbi:Ham1-like protein [Protomyces lactucae-debilis]|uniref:Inosine triphosphate pyrophosphatase n=1 Tax=Protomyces lactucae-debilis TaxID=2754530 RepID=A0A1Y2FW15_PROLT|nr:Ham1-like protein [Protomyces lactucae-debilis]ORY86865.1 Ham1-like protein [Protomyces lactucae-debilis]